MNIDRDDSLSRKALKEFLSKDPIFRNHIKEGVGSKDYNTLFLKDHPFGEDHADFGVYKKVTEQNGPENVLIGLIEIEEMKSWKYTYPENYIGINFLSRKLHQLNDNLLPYFHVTFNNVFDACLVYDRGVIENVGNEQKIFLKNNETLDVIRIGLEHTWFYTTFRNFSLEKNHRLYDNFMRNLEAEEVAHEFANLKTYEFANLKTKESIGPKIKILLSVGEKFKCKNFGHNLQHKILVSKNENGIIGDWTDKDFYYAQSV